jgi:hypothetical protein
MSPARSIAIQKLAELQERAATPLVNTRWAVQSPSQRTTSPAALPPAQKPGLGHVKAVNDVSRSAPVMGDQVPPERTVVYPSCVTATQEPASAQESATPLSPDPW